MHCPPSFAGHIGGSKILAESNWEYFLSSLAGLAAPREAGDTNRLRARVDGLKARTTQADMLVSMNALEFSNLAELLPRIRVPVLVVHPPEQQWVSQEEASRTAALAPNGRLVVLKGADFFGGVEAANAITSFFEDMQTAVNAKGSEIDEGRHDLSHREVEVLRLVAVGKTNREIADELFISLNTVMRHVSHIYDKAGVSNRAQAAVYARVHGIA
jgi:DNA-binding NarL/FixJ family response regulator